MANNFRINNGDLAESVGELSEMVTQTSASLAETVTQLGSTMIANTNKGKNTIVSFVCDDGAFTDLTKLLPIVKELNFPIALAIITDWVGLYEMSTQFMSWDEIKQFSDAGCEIISHTRQQQHLTQLTDDVLDNNLKESRDILRQHGYYSDLIAYPYGENDERVRKYARKYYRAAFGIKGDTGIYGSNASELHQFNIARVSIGSGYDPVTGGFPTDTTSLEYYKSRVDEAISNDSWVVFMLHTSGVLNTTQQQHLKDLVDYIRSLNIPILNPSKALEEVGNVIDIGEKTSKYLKVSASGEIKTNMNDFQMTKYTGVDAFNFESFINTFSYGITMTPISTIKSQTTINSPVNVGGTLMTYRVSASQDFNYQMYISVTGEKFTRNCQSNGTFTAWVKEQLVRYTNIDEYNFDATVGQFKYGITMTPISTVIASTAIGSPANVGGSLITYKDSVSTDFAYQDYIAVDGKRFYRNGKSDGTWSTWQILSKLNIQTTIPSITIPANSTYNYTFTSSNVKNTSILNIFPNSNIENGLLYSAFVVNDKDVTVRFANVTPNPIITAEKIWNINIIR